MVFNKKAISPVVATALLLVVAVVAVVGFQSWFTTYQSGVNAKVEQESTTSSTFTVERLEANADAAGAVVYVRNNGASAVNVSIEIPDIASCNPLTQLQVGATSVQNGTVPGCAMGSITAGDKVNVVVISPTGVFSSTQIAR